MIGGLWLNSVRSMTSSALLNKWWISSETHHILLFPLMMLQQFLLPFFWNPDFILFYFVLFLPNIYQFDQRDKGYSFSLIHLILLIIPLFVFWGTDCKVHSHTSYLILTTTSKSSLCDQVMLSLIICFSLAGFNNCLFNIYLCALHSSWYTFTV